MKKQKYIILFIIGFVIWIIGTWHGGWSNEPQSVFERFTDLIGWTFIMWGIIGDIARNLHIKKVNEVSIPPTAQINLHQCSHKTCNQ